MQQAIYWLRMFCTLFAVAIPSFALAGQPALVFIIDSSNSMWSQVQGENKVVLLRGALDTAFGSLAGKIEVGVVSFGHREQNTCGDIETVIPVGSIDRQAYMQAINQLNPKGATPIAASLRQAFGAAIDDDDRTRRTDIVLVFDGADNCAGNPCLVASELKQQNPSLRIHAIAFSKGSTENLQPLSCLASNTGGTFFNATNKAELETAFSAITAVASSQPMPAPMLTAQDQNQPATAALPVNPMTASSNEGVTVPMVVPTLRRDPIVTGSVATTNEPEATDSPELTDRQNAPSPENAAREMAAPGVDPLQGVRQQIASENLVTPGRLRLSALLTAEATALQSGLVWRVFSSTPDEQGNFRVVARNEEAQPEIELKVGKYIVHVAYGRANLTQEVNVVSGNREEILVLNAGGLRLTSQLQDGGNIDSTKVIHTIYSSVVDEFGQRKLLLSSAPENLIIRLNSGAYHIVSQYGDANAIVRADIQIKPGQLTEASVSHDAAFLTFKLVNEEGGEAMAGTSWSILNPEGDVIVESVGAFPSFVLAAGGYSVIARNGGKSYNRNFNVVAGRDQEVEVITQ